MVTGDQIDSFHRMGFLVLRGAVDRDEVAALREAVDGVRDEALAGRADTFGIPNFDCDIYLDEATIENGCLYGLVGHHLVGHVDVEKFTADGVARMREFLRERDGAGGRGASWRGAVPGTEGEPDTVGPDLELTAGGFVFRGQPGTPPRYWERLIAELTPEETRAARELTTAVRRPGAIVE